MSFITSKQLKKQDILDPIFILLFSALVLLAIFAVSTGNISYLVDNVVDSFESGPASISVDSLPSFASDQRYWAANCADGWSSDLLCDTIAARAQACEINADSVYCSTYKNDLRKGQ